MNRGLDDSQICVNHITDEGSLRNLKESLEREKDIHRLSSTFKALSDPTRLKIIYILSKSELCVCEISSILEMTQSAISHQLKILRDINLVKFRKEGKLVVYSLDDSHVVSLFEQGLHHVKHK